MSFMCYIIRIESERKKMMKRLIYKHLLRAKYQLEGRYYWKLSTAIKDANDSMHRAIVWSMDYKKMYDSKSRWESPVHPDANNFYTRW